MYPRLILNSSKRQDGKTSIHPLSAEKLTLSCTPVLCITSATTAASLISGKDMLKAAKRTSTTNC